MKYLLAYLIEGEAKKYHLNLSNMLARKYRLDPVSSRIDPHLTLKAPFETDNSEEMAAIVRQFVKKERVEPLTLGGFGHFDGKVVYMDVHAPKQTYMQIRRLQDQLQKISWLQFDRYEIPITLHATLCYPKTKEQCGEIISSLTSEKEEFELVLDNISFLKKRGDKWQLVQRFTIE